MASSQVEISRDPSLRISGAPTIWGERAIVGIIRGHWLAQAQSNNASSLRPLKFPEKPLLQYPELCGTRAFRPKNDKPFPIAGSLVLCTEQGVVYALEYCDHVLEAAGLEELFIPRGSRNDAIVFLGPCQTCAGKVRVFEKDNPTFLDPRII